MLYPGETVRLLRPVPEHGLPQYSEGSVVGVRRNEEGAIAAVEIAFYRDSRTVKAEVEFDAVELVIANSGLDRTAVLWGLEESPRKLVEAAMHSLLDTGAQVVTSGPAWDGCVVAFSGQQRFHLEFRLQGRGEATVLLHEREAAFAEQSRTTHPAMSVLKALMNLCAAIGARYCAFPVADPWLWDEDWRSLLRPPLYPDLLLLPRREIPDGLSETFRIINLTGDRAIVTVLPVKASPAEVGVERSDRAVKIDHLRRCKALGEKYYDQMYESRFGPNGRYSNAKDAFYDAISAANELGMKDEAEELSQRLAHIKAVFRSQFS